MGIIVMIARVVGCWRMRINDCRVIEILSGAFISRTAIAKVAGIIANARRHRHHH